MAYTPSHMHKRLLIRQISTYNFSADITPDTLKLCRVTKINVLFLIIFPKTISGISFLFSSILTEFKSIAAIFDEGLFLMIDIPMRTPNYRSASTEEFHDCD